MNKSPRVHWAAPSEATAFEGWLEGKPTKAQEQQGLEEARQKRRVWKPAPAAWELLVELMGEIPGQSIQIQLWNSIMLMLEDEGPFPIRAQCLEIAVRPEKDGVLQAYLKLAEPKSLRTRDGYEGRKKYLQPATDPNTFWLNLANVDEILLLDGSKRKFTNEFTPN